jgi:hypothetical protein
MNDDHVAPSLIDVRTVNSDNDTQIDMIMLTFDEQIEDSTLDISQWTVGLYTINRTWTGTTANDNVIYLVLNLNSVPDTGATPNVSYIQGTFADRNRNLLNTTSKVAIDACPPVLGSFKAIILFGNVNIAIATFSEPVTGVSGSNSPLTFINFVYTSTNGNASNISTFLDANASDALVVMRLNALALSDFNVDTVVAHVFDFVGLASVTTPVLVTKGDILPPVLVQATTGDSDFDGQIDHLSVVFNESMLVSSIVASTFTLPPYTLINAVVNDYMIDFDVTGSTGLDGWATPNLIYTPGIASDLNGNFLGTFNTSSLDRVAPFLMDCSSTLPFIKTIDCVFSEPVSATAADFLLTGPLATAAVTAVSGPGTVITITINRNLTLNDFKTHGIIDLQASNTVIDLGGNIGRRKNVTLRNTDIYPPFIVDVATRDRNCNGRIDAIEIVFNEGIIDTNVNTANFAVGGGLAFNGVQTGLVTDDNSVFLNITEGSSLDSDIGGNFNLTYTPGTLTDLSENLAAFFTSVVRDGAGVALVGATGSVDTTNVFLSYSSPLSANNNITQFTLYGFSDTIAFMLDKDGSDNNISLTMNPALKPSDFIGPARITSSVLDLLGNPACGLVALTNPDKTLPTVVSIKTGDSNSNGYIDSFVITLSKNLDESSLHAGEFTVANYSVVGISAWRVSPPSAVFIVWIQEKNDTLPDASATPAVTYSATGTLTDRYGNTLAGFSGMASTDGAGPAILHAVGLDSTLTLTFSKPIVSSANGSFQFTDIVYTAHGSSPNAIISIHDSDGSDSTLTFGMLRAFVSADFTGDTVSGVSTIADTHGNPLNASASVPVTAASSVTTDASTGLSPTDVALIGGVGGGGLFLLIAAAVIVVILKKKGGECCKKKKVEFDKDQIADEFDFGSSAAGETEMIQSSRGVARLEA